MYSIYVCSYGQHLCVYMYVCMYIWTYVRMYVHTTYMWKTHVRPMVGVWNLQQKECWLAGAFSLILTWSRLTPPPPPRCDWWGRSFHDKQLIHQMTDADLAFSGSKWLFNGAAFSYLRGQTSSCVRLHRSVIGIRQVAPYQAQMWQNPVGEPEPEVSQQQRPDQP